MQTIGGPSLPRTVDALIGSGKFLLSLTSWQLIHYEHDFKFEWTKLVDFFPISSSYSCGHAEARCLWNDICYLAEGSVFPIWCLPMSGAMDATRNVQTKFNEGSWFYQLPPHFNWLLKMIPHDASKQAVPSEANSQDHLLQGYANCMATWVWVARQDTRRQLLPCCGDETHQTTKDAQKDRNDGARKCNQDDRNGWHQQGRGNFKKRSDNRRSDSRKTENNKVFVDYKGPCPKHPNTNHPWGECFNNPCNATYNGGADYVLLMMWLVPKLTWLMFNARNWQHCCINSKNALMLNWSLTRIWRCTWVQRLSYP